jgi:hypothetical protein
MGCHFILFNAYDHLLSILFLLFARSLVREPALFTLSVSRIITLLLLYYRLRRFTAVASPILFQSITKRYHCFLWHLLASKRRHMAGNRCFIAQAGAQAWSILWSFVCKIRTSLSGFHSMGFKSLASILPDASTAADIYRASSLF